MIGFKCSGCGASFSVKDEFAGRKTKCPKCATPLRVPADSAPPAKRALAAAGRPYYVQFVAQAASEGDGGESSPAHQARLLETAIEMGLTGNDEAAARLYLAQLYRELAFQRTPDANIESLADNRHFRGALEQLEKGAKLDSEGRYGVFKADPELALLETFASAFMVMSRYTKNEKGAGAAIAYLNEKLAAFSHVPGDPLSQLVFEMGCLYWDECQDFYKAWECFEKVLGSRPTPGCEDERKKLHAMAKNKMIMVARSRHGY